MDNLFVSHCQRMSHRSICPSAETSRSIALELERLEGDMQEEGAREGKETKGEKQGIREEAGGKVPAPRRRLETEREVLGRLCCLRPICFA